MKSDDFRIKSLWPYNKSENVTSVLLHICETNLDSPTAYLPALLQFCTAVLVSITLPQTLITAWESVERNAKDQYSKVITNFLDINFLDINFLDTNFGSQVFRISEMWTAIPINSHTHYNLWTADTLLFCTNDRFFGPLDCCHGNLSRQPSVCEASSPNLFLKAHQTHQTLSGTLPRLSVLRIASGYVSMGIVQSCISGSTFVIVAMDMAMVVGLSFYVVCCCCYFTA